MFQPNTFSIFVRTDAWLLVSILFILMLACIAFGLFIGKRRFVKAGYIDNPSNGTLYGSIFGLLAFLLGFTFSMSGSRYDSRRQASVAEANDISTAILRADLYPDSERVAFRTDFKNYLQARIDNITARADLDKINKANADAAIYSAILWKRAMDYSKKNPNSLISLQMTPALNAMFDSATSNTYSELIRVPDSIVIMLFLMSLISAFFAGYISSGKGKFDWFMGAGFCLLTAVVVFITLDLDRPRRGFIKLDASRQAIISLMDQFKKN